VRGEVTEVLDTLAAHRPDVVFNVCEAPLGRPDREAHVAALLEWLGVRFTGRAARRSPSAAVPVPRAGVFPCIVKPADEDGSAGIDAGSVCPDAEALHRARSRLAAPILVEEFLPGREFAVALWGRSPCTSPPGRPASWAACA
jgi:D-alanine-D-alanine ligase